MDMFDPSTLEIERIYASSLGLGLRTIGVTATTWDSGTTSLAKSLASRSALAEQKTLYVDLTTPVRAEGDPSEGEWQPHLSGPGQAIQTGGDEPYDRLILHADLKDAMAVRDRDRLKIAFNSDLIRYRAIVVDLPPIPRSNPAALPSNIGAASCEGIVLIGLVGAVTEETLSQSYEAIRATGTQLLGMVLNDRDAPTLGQEMAREALRFRRVFPWLANGLASKALKSKLLNSRP
ncbi:MULTISPECIES: hypothetical protein [Pseudovibrio]|uniref:hypothetical protein n=1 Tax=Stappiaceae TaxID=2821832 RepID=UPI002366B142|nr:MULTISPECIES: hypothetical protein [Pseudovibrio]MDD7909231.1 hypothetical protein [Pseudovibrio exalbescens]MDX5595222.1 hypothetical protein [Pseudovibrio sp. SPO723]